MALKCGIIGLPNVGKSTIFNTLTSNKADVGNYPFCTIDANVGIVDVPDERLVKLIEIYKPAKVIPATVEFVDIAGLVKGAHKGEGLGNKFLGHIREVDALVHIVRCFDDPDVSHLYTDIDPVRDIDIVNTELILADLESIESRYQKIEKKARTTRDKRGIKELDILSGLKDELNRGKICRDCKFSMEEEAILKEYNLLTMKPVLYVANTVDNEDGSDRWINEVEGFAAKEGSGFLLINGKLESEIKMLPAEEQSLFYREMGIKESGITRLIRAAYNLLQYITFFTGSEKEVRAWNLIKGTEAARAAGKIHSDIERGFIRAEVMSYNDLISLGSPKALKEKGLLHLEGKDYMIKDGDLVYFRFNV
ncbi:MAG: redox-regulated ATPase YchF [Nitrospirota bacterium]